jgi:phytoene dehydrogenase-like protein
VRRVSHEQHVQAMVDALARGAAKRGAALHARSHVQEILLEGRRAAGVRLANGAVVRA